MGRMVTHHAGALPIERAVVEACARVYAIKQHGVGALPEEPADRTSLPVLAGKHERRLPVRVAPVDASPQAFFRPWLD